MLAVARSWTPSLFAAAKRPLLATRWNSTHASADNDAMNQFTAALDDFAGRSTTPARAEPIAPEDVPPTAGPDGYPPPAGPTQQKHNLLANFKAAKPRYRLHIHSTRNNTITTFTKPNGHVVAWFSGGKCGFKKVNRSGYEAGYQCAVQMFREIEKIHHANPLEIDLFLKGFGQGRDALQGALLSSEGKNIKPLVASVTDRTPIKIGGTRAKKARRL